MTRKIPDSLIDHAAELVRNGSTIAEAASNIGISYGCLLGKLKQIGVKPVSRKRSSPQKLDLPVEQVCSMYQDGKSENAIANHFGVSRNVIRKRITEAGISPRTQSEAEKLKWAQMGEQARANQVKHAHNAVRGMTKSESAKEAMALTRELVKYDHLIGIGEVEFSDLLNDRGIDHVHQKAIKFYNVDFAIGKVAVEFTADCGRYTAFNPKEIKRAKHLLECGYHVVAVEFDCIESMINCADYIISQIEIANSLDASISEYWVIRCRRKDYAISTNDLGQFTSKPAPVEFVTTRSVIDFS